MKNLDKTEFCLGLQLKHLPERMFAHQSTHTERWVLEKFNMGKYHPLNPPLWSNPKKWIRTSSGARVMMMKYWDLKFPT
jgi:hypothetical protein